MNDSQRKDALSGILFLFRKGNQKITCRYCFVAFKEIKSEQVDVFGSGVRGLGVAKGEVLACKC